MNNSLQEIKQKDAAKEKRKLEDDAKFAAVYAAYAAADAADAAEAAEEKRKRNKNISCIKPTKRQKPTDETKAKISQSLKGRKLSCETVEKMKASNAATRARKNKAKFAEYQSRKE